MRRILKWAVPVDDQWHPIGAGPVVLVDSQVRHVVHVWTDERTDGTAPPVPVRAFGTGQPVPDDLEHLGSVVDTPFVWHLFAAPARGGDGDD